MFKQFPLRYCKDHLCDCCLNQADKLNKYITKEIKRKRVKNLYEGKMILLGEC